MQKGYKTSEFWLSLLAMLFGAYMASGYAGDDHWSMKVAGIVVAGLAALGYNKGRAKIKEAQAMPLEEENPYTESPK